MAATPSLKVIKSFPYRDGTGFFSNRYHFNGGTPADTAHWTSFSDAVVADEKDIFDSAVHITGTIGYEAGSDVPVFSKAYSQAGGLALVAGIVAYPGDSAVLLRYSTTARTSKNHPVYLFNYFHRGLHDPADPVDDVWGNQLTAIGEYGDDWIAGFSDGTHTLVRAGPNGATATGHFVNHLVTHRDFPR